MSQKQICASNVPYMPITSNIDTRQLCQFIYLTWTQCMKMWPWPLAYIIQHYWHMPLNKYAFHCTCDPLHFYCSLQVDPTFLHILPKINKLQHILNKLLQKMFQEQICPWRHIYAKFLDMHVWRKYANICAKYKVTVIKTVVCMKGHRQRDGWSMIA